MVIFGGVDVEQQRFNDVFIYNYERHSWMPMSPQGDLVPQARTFHRSVAYKNVMYVMGGFDGSRLNDMHMIAFPRQITQS